MEASKQELLYKYVLHLGDNAMIIGHRLSELCGHGPTLETDIALTNIALDFYGQVRNYYQYAAKLSSNPKDTEDTIASLRTERQYYNVLLLEQPNTDFAHVITRQFFYDVYHKMLLEKLSTSKDETISAIAVKSLKEVKYHLRFSTDWVVRLGAGTDVSREKMQKAVNHLYPFTGELFQMSKIETDIIDTGINTDVADFKDDYLTQVKEVLKQATLVMPESQPRVARGKSGIHTEYIGFILSEIQYMQRTYPEMQW